MYDTVLEIAGVTLDSFQISTLLRMVFAAVCGGLIGLERELKGRPAGLKTFSLVCVGATLAMITNEYISVYVSGGSGDAARMAAQVISGIGFLGAGTIIVTGVNQIKGLTTAAALWVTAALGITIGTGFYFGAIAGTAVVYLFSGLFRMLDQTLSGNSRFMRICVEGTSEEFMMELLDFFSQRDIHVKSLTRQAENCWYKDDICVTIALDFGHREKHKNILEHIQKMEGLRFLEEL